MFCKDADPGGGADEGKLQVESEEPVKLWRLLGFLLHLDNDVVRVNGKFQGGLPGAENIELLFVSQKADVWIP